MWGCKKAAQMRYEYMQNLLHIGKVNRSARRQPAVDVVFMLKLLSISY